MNEIQNVQQAEVIEIESPVLTINNRLEIIEEGLRKSYLARLNEMQIAAVGAIKPLEEDLIDNIRGDGTIDPDVKERVIGLLRNYFKPEFLNRVDDIIVFSPLTENQITEIISLEVHSLEKRLAEREITLEITDRAKTFIAHSAYDPSYGARPIKRYLQNNVENRLAVMIINGDIIDGCRVTVDENGSGLEFSVEEPAAGEAS